MKRIIPLVLAFSCAANASVWDDLKKTPATQYDVGRIYLDLGSMFLSQKLAGQNVGDTKYEIKGVSSTTVDNRLGLAFAYVARGKYIDPKECGALLNITNQFLDVPTMLNSIWVDIDDATKQAVIDDFVIEVKQVNQDNDALINTCHN